MPPEKIVRIALLLANFFIRLTTSYYIKFGLVYFFRFTYYFVEGILEYQIRYFNGISINQNCSNLKS